MIRHNPSFRDIAIAALMVLLVGTAAGCGDDGSSSLPTGPEDAADVTVKPDAGDDADEDSEGPDDTGPDTPAPDVGEDAEEDVPPDADEDIGVDADEDTTVVEDLQILDVTPNRGSIEGQELVEVNVIGLLEDPQVFFGARRCTDVRVVTDDRLECYTPAGGVGLVDVKVTTATETDTLEDAFTYFQPLRVSSVDPSRSIATGGVLVEIEGASFHENVQVSIGGRSAIGVEVLESDRILAFTPPGVPGLADVRVSDENSSSVLEDGLEYYEPVTLTSIVPGAGPAAGGNTIALLGTGFVPDATVRIGGLTAPSTVLGSDRIEVVVPGGSPGPVDVEILTSNGVAGRPNGYTYFDAMGGGVVLGAVAPQQGPVAGGQEVVLSGIGFDASEVSVTFDGADAVLIEIADNAIRVRTPAGVGPGAVDVTISNEEGSSTLSGAYTYLPTLRIDSVDPAEGPVEGGTPITLTGEGFVEGSNFAIGPLAVQNLVRVSDTVYMGVTPPGSLGDNDVRVITADQQAALSDGFRYTAPSVVHSFLPERGSIAGGTFLTIRGEGFVGPVGVELGNVACADVTLVDQATITCRTPPGREGAVPVIVSNGDGEVLVAEERFVYFNPASRFGGLWGNTVNGTVNVSVFSVGGEPVEEAFVMLTVNEESQYQGLTDENGLITFSGAGLSGTQYVSATAAGYSSASVQAFNAENVTLLLFPTPPPSGGGGGGTPLGTITGEVGGFQKIAQPGPNERQVIIVETSRESPFRANPWPGNGNIVDANGSRQYTMTSRLGDVAVIAWGGIINDITGDFTPYALGIARFVFVAPGETTVVNLELSVDLDHPLTFKLNGVSLQPTGPNINRITPWVDLGFEGVFGGKDLAEGTSNIITATQQAALEGPLSDARYFVIGGSYTGGGIPYALSVIPELTEIDGLIEMPELLGVPQPEVPQSGGVIEDNFVSFTTTTERDPDFWQIQLYLLPNTQIWEFTIPGNQRTFFMPTFPDFSMLDLEEQPTPYAYGGPLLMIITGARIAEFDYNQHEYLNDLRSGDSWVSWTRQSYFVEFAQ